MNISHTDLPLSRLHPNPWNSRRMTDERFGNLKAYMKRVGCVVPLVARELDRDNGTYEILGGEHRWRAAKAIGLKSVPVVVVDCPETAEAKMLSVNLNHLEGADDPALLFKTLTDIASSISVEDAIKVMPFQEDDFRRIAGKLDKEIDAASTMVEKGASGTDAPTVDKDVLYVVVTVDEKRQIEAAISATMSSMKLNRQGEALAHLCTRST